MMNLRDQVDIARQPEEVWTVVADPTLLQRWNPNVQGVEPQSLGRPGRGYRYRAAYALGGKVNQMEAEIEEFRPPVRLAVKITGGRLRPTAFVREVYDLLPVAGGTRLIQTIEWDRAGIPLWFRIIAWFVSRFGRPTGKRFLVRFKELVEEEGGRSRQAQDGERTHA
jgi:carbon monoxide dehydrogenase subunit G